MNNHRYLNVDGIENAFELKSFAYIFTFPFLITTKKNHNIKRLCLFNGTFMNYVTDF